MPDPTPFDGRRSPRGVPSPRSAAERAADHAAIERLTFELLPALVAKLGATGLGELEVREDAWRVRLRRAGGTTQTGGRDRRPSEKGSAERSTDRSADRGSRGLHHALETTTARTESRNVATSPAVGTYHPRADLSAGARVRSGDRLGAVDMLGVPQEVVSPVDGIVGASLVEPGDAVEYGQELLVIEFASVQTSTNGTGVA